MDKRDFHTCFGKTIGRLDSEQAAVNQRIADIYINAPTGYSQALSQSQDFADVVTATLWSTMTERFPKIKTILKKAAPMTAALTERVAALPALTKLAAKAKEDYGDAYCGGYIEKSLRKVLRA